MAFPIMELDYPNVKLTPPPIPPWYAPHLGLIPAGCALRRMKHYLYLEGKADALQKLEAWAKNPTFLEGQCYIDANLSTAISTAFFLDVLPPQASCWERQTYEEVGLYPYLDPESDILASVNDYDDFDDLGAPPYLATDVARQVTGIYQPPWQLSDITTDPSHLEKLVKEADNAVTSPAPCSRNHSPIHQAGRVGQLRHCLLLRTRYPTPSW